MTNNEIMQANLLDIIFENRNKEYGAYALRKGYNKRLLAAMGAGMSVILLLVLMNMMRSNNVSSASIAPPRDEMVIRQIEMPKDKPKEPEQPKQKEVVKVKTAIPKLAQVKFTTPPRIEKVVKDPLPPVENLVGKVTSTVNVTGTPDNGIIKEQPKPIETGGGSVAGPSQPTEKEFEIQERDPEFPGGQAALQKFLAKYLTTPEQMESGEKKVVRIRFKVDKDGSVNTFEIVASGGNSYDNEVVRVCRKMPKWIPAIQNGVNVPVSYILPVTFIGVEE